MVTGQAPFSHSRAEEYPREKTQINQKAVHAYITADAIHASTRSVLPSTPHTCKVIGGDTECPLQVCQLSRSSESTHFHFLPRDVALFGSTRAPDSFQDRRLVPPIYILTFPNIKSQPYHRKPIQMISRSDNYRPFEAVS